MSRAAFKGFLGGREALLGIQTRKIFVPGLTGVVPVRVSTARDSMVLGFERVISAERFKTGRRAAASTVLSSAARAHSR